MMTNARVYRMALILIMVVAGTMSVSSAHALCDSDAPADNCECIGSDWMCCDESGDNCYGNYDDAGEPTMRQVPVSPLLYGFTISDDKAPFELAYDTDSIQYGIVGANVVVGLAAIAFLPLVTLPSYILLDMLNSYEYATGSHEISWESVDTLVSNMLASDVSEFFKNYDRKQEQAGAYEPVNGRDSSDPLYPDLSERNFVLRSAKPRSQFVAGIDLVDEACQISSGEDTPNHRYEQVRLSGCKATAYISDADDSLGAPPILDYGFTASGYPIYLVKVSGQAENGTSEKTQTINLAALGLSDATVALAGFNLALNEGTTGIKALGVDLATVSIDSSLNLTFTVKTWYGVEENATGTEEIETGPTTYRYDVTYAVIGLPANTTVVTSCKSIQGNNYVKSLSSLVLENDTGIIDWASVESWLADAILGNPPGPKLTVLADVPQAAPGCVSYLPRGFRFTFGDYFEKWAGAQISQIRMPLPGIEFLMQSSNGHYADGKPILMYNLAAGFASTLTFDYFYSYLGSESAASCPLKEVIRPSLSEDPIYFGKLEDADGDGAVNDPVYEDLDGDGEVDDRVPYFGNRTFNEALLISKGNWGWQDAEGNKSHYLKASLQGVDEHAVVKMVGMLIDDADDVSYCTTTSH